MSATDRVIYCSQCRHSLYVKNAATGNKNMLRCSRCKELGRDRYLPTDCTYADNCKCFDPERISEKIFRSANAYRIQMCRLRKDDNLPE